MTFETDDNLNDEWSVGMNFDDDTSRRWCESRMQVCNLERNSCNTVRGTNELLSKAFPSQSHEQGVILFFRPHNGYWVTTEDPTVRVRNFKRVGEWLRESPFMESVNGNKHSCQRRLDGNRCPVSTVNKVERANKYGLKHSWKMAIESPINISQYGKQGLKQPMNDCRNNHLWNL